MENCEKNKVEAATLYLVATPIGNLADISERAKKVLCEVDFVAAEDTRNSARLLSAYGIRKELVSYHEHNRAKSGKAIIERLALGESCALVTDAGMPAVSDPGEDIVRLAYDSGIAVSVVPGACAAVSALALSGLSTSRFAFEGFLPVKDSERKARLSELVSDTHTLIFYEAPHKLQRTLADMCAVFGEDRKISLCRELTKINEEVERYTLGEAVKAYEKKEPRGEYVLIIEGASSQACADSELLSLTPEEHVAHYEGEGLSRMDAIKAAARDRGMKKNELYKLLVE